MSEVLDTLDRKNISFKNNEQLNEFLIKVSLMANNIRIWKTMALHLMKYLRNMKIWEK